jgi:hypothetical protein
MTTQTYMTESYLIDAAGEIIGRTNASRGWFGEFRRLGSLQHDWYELEADMQDLHEDTLVYLGDEVA